MFISMLAAYCVANSRYGRTLRSIRENEQLARSIGINTNLHKVGAFMLSGLFAGVGGDLQAYNFRHISPDLYGGATSLYFALMVMLGGPRTIFGPLGGRDRRDISAGGHAHRSGRFAHRLRARADRGGDVAAGRSDRRGRARLSMGGANPPWRADESRLGRPCASVDLRSFRRCPLSRSGPCARRSAESSRSPASI